MTKTTSRDAAIVPKITSPYDLWGNRLGQEMTMAEIGGKPMLAGLTREF